MKLLLRHITYSDNSKKRVLVVNNDNGACVSIKLTVKSWNTLKKLGIQDDKKVIGVTEKQLLNNN